MNNKSVTPNVLHVPYNAYISKHNSTRKNQVKMMKKMVLT